MMFIEHGVLICLSFIYVTKLFIYNRDADILKVIILYPWIITDEHIFSYWYTISFVSIPNE